MKNVGGFGYAISSWSASAGYLASMLAEGTAAGLSSRSLVGLVVSKSHVSNCW